MITRAEILALNMPMDDQAAASHLAAGNDLALADWLNEDTAHIVWRSSLTPDMSRAAIIQGATQLDALTVGKRDSLFWLASGNLDVSNAGVRAAIDDLCGSQNTLKGALQAAQKRPANRAEKVLAGGAGTALSPALLGWEGRITSNDASAIREAA